MEEALIAAGPVDVPVGPKVAQCPCCGLQWEENCEQHASIVLFDECIACRFMPSGKGTRSGTQDDIDAIQAKRRQMLALTPNDRVVGPGASAACERSHTNDGLEGNAP